MHFRIYAQEDNNIDDGRRLEVCRNMSLFRNQALKCGPGTAPFHRAYVLLNSAIRPTDFPSRIDSPLRKTLFANLLQSNAIVNWSWSPSANHDASQGPLGANETCSATVFSGGNRLLIPNIHLGVVDQVSAEIAHHCESSALETIPETEVDILVCTHGARHCHCGETGGKVVELLHTEQAKRSSTKFNIKEVGHVGGHFECVVSPLRISPASHSRLEIPRISLFILMVNGEFALPWPTLHLLIDSG